MRRPAPPEVAAPLEGVPAVQLDEGPRSDVKRQDAPEQDTPLSPCRRRGGDPTTGAQRAATPDFPVSL